MVDGRRSERIRLIPKDGTGYVRATVWIDHDDALLRRVEIEQEGRARPSRRPGRHRNQSAVHLRGVPLRRPRGRACRFDGRDGRWPIVGSLGRHGRSGPHSGAANRARILPSAPRVSAGPGSSASRGRRSDPLLRDLESLPGEAQGPTVGLVTLGCDKNTVDSERILATLVARGAHVTDDIDQADVVVVNTCGFIQAAKEQSIETLLEAHAMRADGGGPRAVVAVGCLVERYKDDLQAEMPEIDLFLGLSRVGSSGPGTRSPVAAGRRGADSDHGAATPGAQHRDRAHVLPEDQRGLRPHLRVLRHPLMRGSIAPSRCPSWSRRPGPWASRAFESST